MEIRPQKGYQEKVLSCNADIVIGWGSAWAGKTFSLLLDPLRWIHLPWFYGVIFRRTTPQIKWGWGLRDESVKLYSNIPGATPKESVSEWIFSSWASLKFTHLEYEKNMLDHQGLQYAFIGFDELTHFTKKQFFYLITRNRSTCWIKPYIRATCNPDPESWVKEFIEWYLDEDWYIIPERDWVIRYFTIDKNNVVWGNSPEEVMERCPHLFDDWGGKELIKSFTFIEWSLEDNKILMEKDPSYKANLIAQDEAVRVALLGRCWKPVADNNSLMNYEKVNSITSNYVDEWEKCISCDVAGQGKDLAVEKTRHGFWCKRIQVFTKSTPEDLIAWIEAEREKEKIPSHRVVYDNDWMGWGLSGRDYVAFKGDAPPVEVNGVKEAYPNLKTQCYYHLANHTNQSKISYKDCEIYVDGVRTDHITMNKKQYKVLDLVKADFRAIKKGKTDHEFKKHINSKKEQKNILNRSPDFWDTAMMRMYLDIKPQVNVNIYFFD